MAKMIVGLVGEDPNDTDSIRNLISVEFPNVQFRTLLKRINGSQLETPKARKMLKVDFEDHNPKAVVFIHDLDGIRTESKKIAQRNNYFETCNQLVNGKGIPLLNIYALEALIYADIKTFNSEYGVTLNFKGDPTMVEKPKEKLKSRTTKGRRKYHENQNPTLFSKMELERVMANCTYFKKFISELKNRIAKK